MSAALRAGLRRRAGSRRLPGPLLIALGLAALAAFAPHAVRRLVGAAHASILITPTMLGGCLVLIADTIALTAFAPVDIPVGVVTAIIGAPYLIWLLCTRTR